MIPPLDVHLEMARERVERLRNEAAAARLLAEMRRARRDARRGLSAKGKVTIRLDRVGDASRLYQLGALCEQRVGPGPFVVAEAGGRVLAAMPLGDGPTIYDPYERTAHLQPLLESRAAEIRGRSRRADRLPGLPQRAWRAIVAPNRSSTRTGGLPASRGRFAREPMR